MKRSYQLSPNSAEGQFSPDFSRPVELFPDRFNSCPMFIPAQRANLFWPRPTGENTLPAVFEARHACFGSESIYPLNP